MQHKSGGSERGSTTAHTQEQSEMRKSHCFDVDDNSLKTTFKIIDFGHGQMKGR